MDPALNIDIFSVWLMQYGSIALFFLLALGIIALPVPEETLMVIAGIFMHSGKLPIVSTVLAALLGTLCGISVSYIIGRTAGHYLITKYGSWVGLTQVRYKKAHDWFERFGKWTLMIGYFIPGVRHLTGVCAGTSDFPYKQFALYAYGGAFAWVSLFLSIGYFFGKQWLALYEKIEIGSDLIAIVVFVVIIGVVAYFYKKIKKK